MNQIERYIRAVEAALGGANIGTPSAADAASALAELRAYEALAAAARDYLNPEVRSHAAAIALKRLLRDAAAKVPKARQKDIKA